MIPWASLLIQDRPAFDGSGKRETGLVVKRSGKGARSSAGMARRGSYNLILSALARSLLSSALSGCALSGTQDAEDPDRGETFAYSTEGRPIRGSVIGQGPETYLCFGVIHGNEPEGGPLLKRFVKHLEERPALLEGRKVVVIPVLNPDGLERKSRTNARGVDLNRNFPARNWRPNPRHGDAPASERETRALLKILRQFRPSRILSIHSPLHCVNFDGPAEEIAQNMARASGYPLRSSIGYETPGSLGSYAGDDLLVPTVTLELPRNTRERELWPRLVGALEEFMTTPEPAAGN